MLHTALDTVVVRGFIRAPKAKKGKTSDIYLVFGSTEGVPSSQKASMDELWAAAKVCRVANVMRPYMESL
jgi:hypothetical protein